MADDFAHEIEYLRAEVERVLAAAIEERRRVSDNVDRVEAAHADEVAALHRHADELDAEILEMIGAQADVVANLEAALATRDLIGQAKGVVMLTTRCTADEAFDLLVRQSQFENRKVVEIAGEVAERASKRPPARER